MNKNIFQKIVDKIEPPIIYVLEYNVGNGTNLYNFPDHRLYPDGMSVYGLYNTLELLHKAIKEMIELKSRSYGSRTKIYFCITSRLLNHNDCKEYEEYLSYLNKIYKREFFSYDEVDLLKN